MTAQKKAAFILALTASIAATAPARADDRAALIDFFAARGCAIGPATRDAAIAEGFSAEFIDAVALAEAQINGATKTGAWLVLAPESCTIRMPDVSSRMKVEDEDVGPVFTASEEDAELGYDGCYASASLFETVQQSRGWDPDTANEEYIRFVAENLISKQLSFYSDSPLSTPPGLMLTTGPCADFPGIKDVRESQNFLAANFDPILRRMMTENMCEDISVGLYLDINELSGLKPGTRTTNAWTSFEAVLIGMGAGWYEGMSATEKGVPRPPLCHYAETGASDAQ
ncbi:MAG: hypothetical protein DI616_06975 [Paracoccus denitrificans]|uniref:Uncharacterized protein n=1 Tax=Paracoccus denitrificans TaxID=266 RepID=A0A533IC72_PARDE|nr:MAG: hypothetical protein DI616_06975 [Paracoccus denitrificans]